MKRVTRLLLGLGLLGLSASCVGVRVRPVEVNVQPIHVTVDVNVKVAQVDQALEKFFDDAYGAASATNAPAGVPSGQRP